MLWRDIIKEQHVLAEIRIFLTEAQIILSKFGISAEYIILLSASECLTSKSIFSAA